MIKKLSYKEAVGLSKTGTKESLGCLFQYLDNGDKQEKKIALKALRDAWNKKAVRALLNEKIEQAEEGALKNYIKIGVYLDREQYLKEYLRLCFENKQQKYSYFKLGVYDTLSKKPLSTHEKKILQEHILSNNDYDKKLLEYSADYETELFFDQLFKKIIAGNNNKELLSFFATNKEYLQSIQPQLRDLICNTNNESINYGSFLVLTDGENRDLLVEQGCIYASMAVQKNVFGAEGIADDRYPLSVAFCILNKKSLSEKDKLRVSDEIDQELENQFRVKGVCAFLKQLSNAEYEMAERLLISIYERKDNYSKAPFNTLLEIRSFFAYRKLSNALLTAKDKTTRYKTAVQLITAYPEKAEMIYKMVKDAFVDDNLLVRIQEVMDKQ